LVESTLWKWPDYQKQSTCSMQSLSKFKWHSAQNRKSNHEIHLETQRPQIAKARSSEQKVQCWRSHNIQLQNILQSHNNKNSMVLAQKQTERPMDQNRRSIHKTTHLQLTDLWQRSPKHTIGEKTASSPNAAGKTGHPHVEDEN
jgi:hypothetical protein